MALVIIGQVVPLASDPAVSSDPLAAFAGQVWIGDDGRVAAVTRAGSPGPAGFADARTVQAGDSLIFPGLVDLHNHLAYDTLPLWVQPGRTTPFAHHNSWPSASTYPATVTWPAYAFITAAPEELLAYVETRALVGGTTTIQGSPPKNRPRDGWLVRNAEDETFGTHNQNLVYASTLTMRLPDLADRANRMRNGSTFIYHCSEGQPGSVVSREFQDAGDAGCLQDRFVAVHCNAVDPAALVRWQPAGAVVWSPFSNLWLYGSTSDVPRMRKCGLTICLGSDWAPSGTKHVLGELKVARLVSDHHGWSLSDSDLVLMATANPGDVLARSWGVQVGRLQPGAIGDVVVLAARPGLDPFGALVAGTERDVQLVVVDGRPRYGTEALMSAAGAHPVTTIRIGAEQRQLSLGRLDDQNAPWPWEEVVSRLEAVRSDPKAEIEAARSALAAWGGPFDAPAAPLRLALDMPTGLAPVGGLPKDLSQIVVPPLDDLTHDQQFLDFVHGHGFHGGVLDGLASYYG